MRFREEVGAGGDHGGIVGAVFEIRDNEATGEGFLEFGAEGFVGGDTTGEEDGLGGELFSGSLEGLDEGADGGGLEAGGEILAFFVAEAARKLERRESVVNTTFGLNGAENGGFEA